MPVITGYQFIKTYFDLVLSKFVQTSILNTINS